MKNTSIIELIKAFKTEEALNLLQENSEAILEKDENGVSAILWTAYYRNEAVLNQIRSLANLQTDIFESCALGLVDTVMTQVAERPDLANSVSPDGFQPLGLASFFGHIQIVEFLLPHTTDVNAVSQNPFKVAPIHSAVAAQSAEIVKALLNHGADPNLSQQNGILPIHSAAHTGNISILKLLIDGGADRSLRSDDGKNCLDYALDSNKSEEIIQVLKTYD